MHNVGLGLTKCFEIGIWLGKFIYKFERTKHRERNKHARNS